MLRRLKIDTLNISALKIATTIGVHAWEQRIQQTLLIDLVLPIDIKNGCDDLTKTVDYADLCAQITTFISSRSFQLIETVAKEVAHFITQHFQLTPLTIKVSKPNAVANAGCIQVSLNNQV